MRRKHAEVARIVSSGETNGSLAVITTQTR